MSELNDLWERGEGFAFSPSAFQLSGECLVIVL